MAISRVQLTTSTLLVLFLVQLSLPSASGVPDGNQGVMNHAPPAIFGLPDVWTVSDDSRGSVKRVSTAAAGRNVRGIHTLARDSVEEIEKHVAWAELIAGPGGHVTQPFSPVDRTTAGPTPEAVHFVRQAYERGLNPIVRLQGDFLNETGCNTAGQTGWLEPVPDAPVESEPTAYREEAEGYRRFVGGLPLDNERTLYVQLGNEPNLHYMWGGRADPAEYAGFFVDVAAAIRSLGEPRIRILNAGLAPEGDIDNLAFIEAAIAAEPSFAESFDFWASHSYPRNQPPANNLHDGTSLPNSRYTIDAYLLELDALRRQGVDTTSLQVILTETGYPLGDRWYAQYPAIDEENRAEYIKLAFDRFWPNWPEVRAVTPFQLSDSYGSWKPFDWVWTTSTMDDHGFPTQAHLQYARLIGRTGVVKGTVRDKTGNRLKDVTLSTGHNGHAALTVLDGSYVLIVDPGGYEITTSKTGYASATASGVQARAGETTRLDLVMAERLSPTLQNESFESGDLAHWTPWGSVDGVQSQPWHFGIVSRDLGPFLGTAVNCGEKDGGVFQSLAAERGRRIEASAWTLTYKEGEAPNGSRIGIDPDGGTNPESAAVVWSNWVETDRTWTRISAHAVAGSDKITVFLQHEQSLSNAWNINAFDAVEVVASEGSG